MTLDALGDGAVELQLDSEGASLEAAWTLIDVIDLLGVPVNIVCSGRVEGAAVGVLAAGERRTALPHARFRLTDPELEISGRASELGALLEHHARRLERLHERVAAATGRRSVLLRATSVRDGRWTRTRRTVTGSSTRSRATRSRFVLSATHVATQPTARRPGSNGSLGFRPGPSPRKP